MFLVQQIFENRVPFIEVTVGAVESRKKEKKKGKRKKRGKGGN